MSYTLVMVSDEPYTPSDLPAEIDYINVVTKETKRWKIAMAVYKALKASKEAYTLVLSKGSTYPTTLPENSSEVLIYGNAHWRSGGTVVSNYLTDFSVGAYISNPFRIGAAFMRTKELTNALALTYGMPDISPLHVAYYWAIRKNKAVFNKDLVVELNTMNFEDDDSEKNRTVDVMTSIHRM